MKMHELQQKVNTLDPAKEIYTLSFSKEEIAFLLILLASTEDISYSIDQQSQENLENAQLQFVTYIKTDAIRHILNKIIQETVANDMDISPDRILN